MTDTATRHAAIKAQKRPLFAIWYAPTPKPWRVRDRNGRTWACDDVRVRGEVETSFEDTGHADLQGGPRGIVYARGRVDMTGAELVESERLARPHGVTA